MIKAMGYPEAEARRALQLAYNNIQRAVQFLEEGLPSDVAGLPAAAAPAPAAAAPASAPAPAAAGTAAATTSSSSSSSSGSGGPLAVLRQHPQFNQLKRVVQERPNMLASVLQQIGAARPELLALITAVTTTDISTAAAAAAVSRGALTHPLCL